MSLDPNQDARMLRLQLEAEGFPVITVKVGSTIGRFYSLAVHLEKGKRCPGAAPLFYEGRTVTIVKASQSVAG